MVYNPLSVSILLGLSVLFSGCSKSDEAQPCDALIGSAEDNICLSLEHDRLTEAQNKLIVNEVRQGIAAIKSLMPINDLRIRIVDDPQGVIPEIGMGGYNPNAQELILYVDADYNDLEEALQEHLIPQLAHEVHHAKRRRSVGYGNTLLQAAVSEGLADHFSMEVSGISPPPWSVALTGEELEAWTVTARKSWYQTYNHRAWFLGTDPNIPRWTGYSIGFELVRNYLSSHPDRSPSDLHDEPASSFDN